MKGVDLSLQFLSPYVSFSGIRFELFRKSGSYGDHVGLTF